MTEAEKTQVVEDTIREVIKMFRDWDEQEEHEAMLGFTKNKRDNGYTLFDIVSRLQTMLPSKLEGKRPDKVVGRLTQDAINNGMYRLAEHIRSFDWTKI